ncbi:mucin-associated surface protein [Pseudarthrobacter sp. Y6]|uniref:mucin-associated surface protein n=1 Tax=Pseudarthrobacter sp. Y6 TaxID=3418422 RepID=UPI003CF0FD05
MSPAPKYRRRSATAKCLTAAAAFLLAGSLAGCGPAATGFQRDAARQLQEQVLGVSQAAANNDPAGGLAALDTFEADLASAVGNGQVSVERRRNIMTAVAAVRADLTAAKAGADAAAAKAAEDAAAAQKQAEAVTAAAEAAKVAPVPASPSSDEGKGSKGKGKDGG